MLGHIEYDESLVLTHNDLFDYFKSIFDAKSMALELKQEVSSATCFIFLGLPFEKWYMQLLLRILSLHIDSEKVLNALKRFEEGSNVKKMYEEQFDIQFIPDEPNNFIENLYQNCSEAGILKSSHVDQPIHEPLFKASRLISTGDIPSAIKLFHSWTMSNYPNSDLLIDLLAQMARYEAFEKDLHKGILDSRDVNVLRNQITQSFLYLIEKAKINYLP